MNKNIYVISDSIGETARIVTKAVSKQFNGKGITIKQKSYVNNMSKLKKIISTIRNEDSIIVYTLVVPELRDYLKARAAEENIVIIDILGPVMNVFERSFKKTPKYEPGLIREMDADYFRKIEAIEFAVTYDDGKDPDGALLADIVLIGVSRTSKTPLSMYLAHKGIKVANFPLVPGSRPPEELFQIARNKCVGLIIDPERLVEFRKERLIALGLTDRTSYTQLERILEELDFAEKVIRRIGCPTIDVSNRAIEETANLIIDTLEIERGLR